MLTPLLQTVLDGSESPPALCTAHDYWPFAAGFQACGESGIADHGKKILEHLDGKFVILADAWMRPSRLMLQLIDDLPDSSKA
jgi:hypothetical protein